MDLKCVNFRKEDGVAWIQFNRPDKLNALNPDVLKDLETAIVCCEEDDAVRVVVIMGHEKAFVVGGDIHDMSKGDINFAYDLSDLVLRVQERLSDLPKPTIAAISGYALGGGLELALCCDLRISAENAVFGLPEITLGIIPGGGGTQRLPRLVGICPATELIFLGEMIKAERAKEIGLVNKVVPFGSLKDEVQAYASKLMERPALALRAAKIAMRRGLGIPLKEGLQIEQNLFCMLFGTEDQKEGMSAFLEKRKAVYTGK
ncbi:MAG: enoyl-CoA hydratase [Deltaproteobacteria bacterium]|nr:enoyl-CoA hydratase [Deltaproteobacteria bacterium]